MLYEYRQLQLPLLRRAARIQRRKRQAGCAACGNNYEPEALEMMAPEESGDEITFANDAKRFDTGGGRHAGQPVERVFLCGFPAGQRAGDESGEKGKGPLRRQPA